MAKKPNRKMRAKASGKLKLPLLFEQGVKGLMGLSPDDAKAAREAAKKSGQQ